MMGMGMERKIGSLTWWDEKSCIHFLYLEEGGCYDEYMGVYMYWKMAIVPYAWLREILDWCRVGMGGLLGRKYFGICWANLKLELGHKNWVEFGL